MRTCAVELSKINICRQRKFNVHSTTGFFEVAALVQFLCSQDAASMTGSAYLMDGGLTAR
ncbi:hypothetical protein DPMN_141779 [Dreissena polymorpha]|uniref:Uncharacterized protein n=1 Tax=Dreissena polymorpha TaxID=45954 RepID=A0A9D4GA36_DREPO|nr:hypothetical protein DPMN_141779 [Dreissena polymorpha]